MNGLERVVAVMEGRQPDRVPLGFYLADCDIIGHVIGRKTYARDKIGQQVALWEGRRDEIVASLMGDVIDFYRKIDLCDVLTHKEAILPSANYQPQKVERLADDVWRDEQGRVYKVSELSNEFVCVEDPTGDAEREFRPEDFPEDDVPGEVDETEFAAFDRLIAELGGERFILGPGHLGAMVLLGGMERGLMEYVTNPEAVRAAARRNVRHANARDGRAIRPGQHGVLFEQDYGTTRAPMMSPAMFREFCFPAIRERTQHVKRHTKYAFLHSCGNTWPLIEMFIEAGLDGYQSLQTGAGMDIDKLREKFGTKLVWWGGIPVETLVKGTADEVRRDVRRACEIAKRGGVILGPSHSIAYGMPYGNFQAMLDEFDRCAWY